MVRCALDPELVASPEPASLALHDPADAILVPVGNTGRDWYSESADALAFAALSVKKLLDREDCVKAWPVCALHQ